jgi:hypothetical protein
MILCECGEFINRCTFRDYIETSSNPSTPTFGHINCGLIFNFVDGTLPKRYSSKKELKSIAMRFAEMNTFDCHDLDRFLIEVDRLKSKGNLSDMDIILQASEITKCYREKAVI